MSGQSGNTRAAGGRWLAVAALAGLSVVVLALVWGGLAPARAQDQTKWWGGVATMELCHQKGLDAVLRSFRDNVSSHEARCLINRTDNEGIGKKPSIMVGHQSINGVDQAYIQISARRICNAYGCYHGFSDGFDVISCRDAEAVKADVLKAIGYPSAGGKATCLFHEEKSPVRRSLFITFDTKAAPQQACDKATFLGAWKNDHAKYAKYGASLTFEKSMVKGEVMGRFSMRKESHNTQYILGNVISTVGPPKGCLFTANLDSSIRQEEGLKYDKATDSFTIVMADGSPNPDFPGRWTRGAPPKAAATCGKDDINGTWHRGDGARILMTGVGVFGGGGHAIMERYPEDRWPKGEMKFRGVKEVSECRYEASCTTINRRTTNGVASYGVTEAACSLTLDPVKRTLTATGGSGVFRRDATPDAKPSAAAEAAEARAQAARRESEAEAARTAALNAEVTRRNAEVQRRNAEVKAADERRQAEYRAALARQKAEADRIKRQDAEAKRKYEADMAAWRARVAACKAGDVAQCGS